ncbi:RagB/SusD family nutrient uptake outer membrane protein [Prevotella sp. khp7]|uniref:RagB/SusD family nutrient uptake outer membrane protein n=1 Tax=Prevotella sp. khp7 TaxID=1761885 RepID=UPI000B81121B|nr:RagB/SusD family nutrient uptake outer membrane protein [Prevotella sp. khp7]
MKTISRNLITGILILLSMGELVSSCNDYLDIEPPSLVSPESYLVDGDQLGAYTIRYYSANFTSINNLYGGDNATDNSTTRSSNNRYLKGEWKVPASGGEWSFSDIYPLNYFINDVEKKYAEGQISGNDAAIRHYIGEGYFLRAYQYFYRLRKLGDFPIIKTVLPDNLDSLSEASKRMPRNEVARFILNDLDHAVSLMSNNPDGGKARLTKSAALVLKARVALFEASWEKYFAGTAFVPNGNGWPGAQKDYNKGYQFPSGSAKAEVNFFLDQAIDASQQIADNVKLTPNSGIIQESEADVNDYNDMFSVKDPSKFEEVFFYRPYDRDLGSYVDWFHHIYYGYARGYTHQFEQSFLMKNGLPIYAAGSGYAGDDRIGDTKVNRDDRWRLFMKAPGEKKTYINTPSPEYFSATPNIYSDDVKYSSATGYIIGKGFSHDLKNQDLGKDETAPIYFRAAEAYLTYIEAYYMRHGQLDAKAANYWKALRRRANVDEDFQKTIDATDMNEEAKNDWGAYSAGKLLTDKTLYNIRRERRCELIGEGFRYDDLIRWRALEQLNGFQIEGCKIWGPMIEDYKQAFGVDFSKLLVYGKSAKENTISSPSLSLYTRPYQVAESGLYYNGLFWTMAHYLSPIAINHFLITAPDGATISDSPIYQNPGWPTEANVSAEE